MNEIQVFTQRLVSQSTAQFLVSESKDIDSFIDHIKSVIQTCKAMAPKQTQPIALATKKKPKPKKSPWKKAEATTVVTPSTEPVATAPVMTTQSIAPKSLGRGVKKDPSEWSPSYRKLMEHKARKAAAAAAAKPAPKPQVMEAV